MINLKIPVEQIETKNTSGPIDSSINYRERLGAITDGHRQKTNGYNNKDIKDMNQDSRKLHEKNQKRKEAQNKK